jgi:prepilin-type processing-associated H-X9-DG protein
MYAQDYDEMLPDNNLYYLYRVDPADYPGGTHWPVLQPYIKNEQILRCPSASADQFNSWGTTYGAVRPVIDCGGTPLALAQFQYPSTDPMYFDCKWWAGCHIAWRPDNWTGVDYRHNEGSNFCFVDGHAKWRGLHDVVANMCWGPNTGCSNAYQWIVQ